MRVDRDQLPFRPGTSGPGEFEKRFQPICRRQPFWHLRVSVEDVLTASTQVTHGQPRTASAPIGTTTTRTGEIYLVRDAGFAARRYLCLELQRREARLR